MKYLGSKSKISKYIVPIINEYISQNNIQFYWEPFGGGMNVIDKVICEHRCATDNNIFLIELFKHLDDVEQMPDEISKDHYAQIRSEYNQYVDNPNAELKSSIWYIGAVGFLASYNGRFFDGGYSGIRTLKNGAVRNYYAEAKRNILRQKELLRGVEFECCDYRRSAAMGNLIYCDPPYKNAKGYTTSKDFDHEQFWEWCREKSQDNIVLISEQEAPDDFECIWEQSVIRSVQYSKSKKATEKLFILKGGDM